MKRNDIDQLIEESLKSEPSFQLRKDFKDKVTLRIRQKERRSQRILYLVLGFVSIAVFSICLVTIGRYFDWKSLNINDGFTPLAVLVGGLIALFQYLDKRLVKDRFFKQAS